MDYPISKEYLIGMVKHDYTHIFFIKEEVWDFCKENAIKIKSKRFKWNLRGPHHSYKVVPATMENFYIYIKGDLQYSEFVKNHTFDEIVGMIRRNNQSCEKLYQAALNESNARFVGSEENILALRMDF